MYQRHTRSHGTQGRRDHDVCADSVLQMGIDTSYDEEFDRAFEASHDIPHGGLRGAQDGSELGKTGTAAHRYESANGSVPCSALSTIVALFPGRPLIIYCVPCAMGWPCRTWARLLRKWDARAARSVDYMPQRVFWRFGGLPCRRIAGVALAP